MVRPKRKVAKKPSANVSFRVLEDKRRTRNETVDVYEFTYDPNEEPPPQKKKRKKVVRKNPSKPKTVVFKSIYDQNVSKALAALKNVVSKKHENLTKNTVKSSGNITSKATTTISNENNANTETDKTVPPKMTLQQNASIRVEDIAADFADHQINYSPVNSPCCPKTPDAHENTRERSIDRLPVLNADPLNLRDDLSFFDDQPAANSSMIMSSRHPQASPWRVEFENLPIRWHVNSYVKADMTPAVECSFVNFEDSKKKHVYTNIVPQSTETLPQIVIEDETPNLKQTSILSYIKEVVEKSATKKKRGRSTTPTRVNLDNITNNLNNNNNKTPRKIATPRKSTDKNTLTPKSKSADPISNDKECDKENVIVNKKRKNNSDSNITPAKTPRKDRENTYFGFDDSENVDSENITPKDARKRSLRPRARAVLKEINQQALPTRALLPVAPKSKALNSETRTKLCEEMKSATDAPVFPDKVESTTDVPLFPEKGASENIEATNITEAEVEELNEDSQSVHLFEDIELIHHLKPLRKSYGKAKKVTFRQRSTSGSDTQDSNIIQPQQDNSSEGEDQFDLTFEMPEFTQKKTAKKKPSQKHKMTKKEEQEAEAWAANFNSMCDDIEEFPLVVE